MANNNVWLIFLIIIFIFLYNNPQSPPQSTDTDSTGLTLEQTIDSSVSFTGQNLYVAGTALTSEFVRVIKLNGGTELKNLGYESLDSGTLNTKPNDKYKFYFFMNDTVPSTTYYVDIEEYTAPVSASVDDKIGYGCTIDTSPIFTSFDSVGRQQSASANAQAVSANGNVDISILIKASSDTCFGMPDSPRKNIVCFNYNANAFSEVETNTGFISPPRTTGTNITSGAVKCYTFDLIADGSYVNIPVHLTGGSTEPTTSHNITVYAEDAAFDLNADTLAEIHGYTDEDGNSLASPLLNIGTIYIS